MARSDEWLIEQIDEYFKDTSRTPAETIEGLEAACEHIAILTDSLEQDLKREEEES